MVDSSNIFRVMYNLNSDRLYSCETIGELGICGIDWSTPEVFDFSISPDFLKTFSHITHIRHNHVSDNFSSNELLYLGGLFGEDHIIFNDSLSDILCIKLDRIHITINKLYDEYYIFTLSYRSDIMYNYYYLRCDGFDGLKQLLNDLLYYEYS